VTRSADRLASRDDVSAPDLLSHFWAPLTAVGSHDAAGRPNAQICVSVFGASIVPERPRLLVVLHRTNLTHDLVAESGTLAVTLLSEGQTDLLEPLGLRSGRDGEKLDGLALRMTAAGDPIFPDGVGYLACEVLEASDLGDATAYLVAVRERASLGGEGELRAPMRWADARERLGAPFLDRWAEKSAHEREAARASMHWS
jgi:flavin reductase (DIM6/NTAB) family NADH-FMN oxidoreductase RutF